MDPTPDTPLPQPDEAFDIARRNIELADSLLACPGWNELLIPWMEGKASQIEANVLAGNCKDHEDYVKQTVVAHNLREIARYPGAAKEEAVKVARKTMGPKNHEPRSNL